MNRETPTTLLRLYVAPNWRRERMRHIPLLYPFWGNPQSPKTPFHYELFARHGFDTKLYFVTEDAHSADIVLMPYAHAVLLREDPCLIEECVAEAARLGKPLLIDGLGDIEFPVTVQNSIVLRYGGYRFKRKENEIILPLYADDLLEIFYNSEPNVRSKGELPVIGFSGWSSIGVMQTLRSVIKELPSRLHGLSDSRYRACKKGVFFRRKALSLLESSPLVRTNFLARSSFSGHTDTASKDQKELRREFVQNLLESDYGLDLRGDANGSIRLFEILSLGRIPVIIDTERNFPFRDKVDYKSFSLMVDFKELHRLPEIISEFHAGLSDEQFRAMQLKAREAFVRYFRVDAMTHWLMEELFEIINKDRGSKRLGGK